MRLGVGTMEACWTKPPNFGTAEWYEWKWCIYIYIFIETCCQPRKGPVNIDNLQPRMCFLCFINFQIEHTSRSRAGRNFWLGRVFSQVNLKILRTWRWTKLTCSKCSKHFNQDESSQFFVYLSKCPKKDLYRISSPIDLYRISSTFFEKNPATTPVVQDGNDVYFTTTTAVEPHIAFLPRWE